MVIWPLLLSITARSRRTYDVYYVILRAVIPLDKAAAQADSGTNCARGSRWFVAPPRANSLRVAAVK